MPSSTEAQFGSSGILKERAIQERIATAIEAQLGGTPIRGGVDAFSITYVFPAVDLGGGAKTERIEGVEGFRGTVRDICYYDCTEVFSDTDVETDVGINGGDTDAYINGADMGVALAVGGSVSVDLTAGVTGTIPVGEDILVSMSTPTTGTTGIANVAVTIQYFR